MKHHQILILVHHGVFHHEEYALIRTVSAHAYRHGPFAIQRQRGTVVRKNLVLIPRPRPDPHRMGVVSNHHRYEHQEPDEELLKAQNVFPRGHVE